MKGQCNKNKRQRTESTKLAPISFVELKIKQEKDKSVSLKVLFYPGAISTLLSQAVRHLKMTIEKVRCFLWQREFFNP